MSCASATIGVSTNGAASTAATIELLAFVRRGKVMALPACPPSLIRHLCLATGLRGRARLELPAGQVRPGQALGCLDPTLFLLLLERQCSLQRVLGMWSKRFRLKLLGI